MQKFKLHISFLAVLLLQISALLGSQYLIHYTGHKWSITMHQKTKSKNNNNNKQQQLAALNPYNGHELRISPLQV